MTIRAVARIVILLSYSIIFRVIGQKVLLLMPMELVKY